MDKWRSKMIWLASGLPTPRYRILSRATTGAKWCATSDCRSSSNPPTKARPRTDQGHRGCAIAGGLRTRGERYHDLALAEQFIDGPEYTAGVLGDSVLPLIRIEAPQGNYDYQNKYFGDATKYLCPCGLDAQKEEALKVLALKAFGLVGCAGWGRID